MTNIFRITASMLVVTASLLGGCIGHGEHTTEGLNLAKSKFDALKSANDAQIAKQQFLAGDLKKAKKTIEKSLSNVPNVASSHALLGRIFLEEGNLEAARECFTKAQSLDEKNVDSHYYMGIVHERTAQYQDAFACYSKAAEYDTDNPQYVVAAAEMLVQLNKHEQAEALLQSRQKDFQYNAAIRQSLGNLAMIRKDYKAAVGYYADAHRLAPDDMSVLEQLTRAQLAAGENREAEFNLSTLSKSPANKNRRDLPVLRAQTLMQMGRVSEARALLSQLTGGEDGSRDVQAWIMLGQVCVELKDWDRLRLVAGRLSTVAPERYEGPMLRSIYYQNTGDPAQALRALDAASKIAPDNAEPWMLKAMLLQDLGRMSEAAVAAREAILIDPNNVSAQQLAASLGVSVQTANVPAANGQ